MKKKLNNEATAPFLNEEMQKRIDNARTKSRSRENRKLAAKHQKGELIQWPEDERGVPNELVRCALFSAKNRKEKRKSYDVDAPLRIPVIGGGEVRFSGKELRQDDETVWMQLIHLSKEFRSEVVEFTPYSFLKTIKWSSSGPSYNRLLDSIRRLSSARLEIDSPRFNGGVGIGLIGGYVFHNEDGEPKNLWSVQVFSQASNLFIAFDKLYSRVNFETRLSLPEGVSTWLHGFFSSHKEPFDHRFETLAKGAGVTLETPEDNQLSESERASKQRERLREAKKLIIKALDRLKEVGFLKDYRIVSNELVRVVRSL